MHKKNSAFTLIELMVVVAIIALLAVIGIASYANALKKARDSKKMADIENFAQALVLYRSDIGYYPTSGAGNASNKLKSGKYLSTEMATTFANGTYTYTSASSGTPKTFVLCTTKALENTKSANSSSNTALNACTGGASGCSYWCVTNP